MPDRPQLPVAPLSPSPELDLHFDALREGRLLIPHCESCDAWIWYPRPFCPLCSSTEVNWLEASGEGAVYSFTTVQKGVGLFDGHAPYVVAYVELDEGPRVLTNIVGPTDKLTIGARVAAEFDLDGDGTPILRFRVRTRP